MGSQHQNCVSAYECQTRAERYGLAQALVLDVPHQHRAHVFAGRGWAHSRYFVQPHHVSADSVPLDCCRGWMDAFFPFSYSLPLPLFFSLSLWVCAHVLFLDVRARLSVCLSFSVRLFVCSSCPRHPFSIFCPSRGSHRSFRSTTASPFWSSKSTRTPSWACTLWASMKKSDSPRWALTISSSPGWCIQIVLRALG